MDATQEFQVILLAGGQGNRLYPLTEGGRPKALLPVANKPMIYHPLDMLRRAGFTDIIILARTSHKQQITHFVKEVHSGTNVELVFLDGEFESADALRQIKDKIKTNFIVVSTDLVTDVPLHHVIDLHRSKNATMTSVVFETPKSEDGKKVKADPGVLEYIGLDPSRTRLLFTVAAADVDEHLKVRTSLMNRFPVVNVHTNLTSAHLFIFKKWVINVLVENKSISSIQDELVPFLVKCQAQPNAKTGPYAVSHLMQPSENLAETMSTTSKPSDPITCSVYYYNAGFSARANTLTSYAEINRQICKGACPPFAPADRIHPTADINQKTQVGNDSMVAEGSRIGERCSVKKSIIGKHCTIGKNVKITNSVLMDHVTVQDSCKLDGVIVCHNAYIKENVSLKDCEVGYSFTIEKDVNAKNEKFSSK